MSKFKEKLKEKRLQCKLTQIELAEMLNVSDRTVSKWETGNGYPDITILSSIAYCLNTTVSDLIDSDDIVQANVTKVNPSVDLNRSKFRKLLVISVSLLLSALLFIVLPIIRYTIPNDSIGAIGGNSDLYNTLAVVLTILVSISYIISVSTFVYMMLQYSHHIKARFYNFNDRKIIKKYAYIYFITLGLMIAFIILTSMIEI